ncbi:MAG TPA: CpsD/CapB family tyrosine-protein kinase [Patescibacteria group bacterium]|jgi:Mrp family chromosome partitioning ATPase|nr:CpsD/CapB family tyrosine-protein kinase [Patescibacteria group bacterium]
MEMTKGTWARSDILVALYDQTGMGGEQFRKLQVKLRALKHATGGKLNSIVVTSPLMSEGKTACATNLAVALSFEPTRRVLLIDCDVRKPKVQSYLVGAPGRGLLDVLAGRASVEDVVLTMPGGNLDVMVLPLVSSGSGGGGGAGSNGSRPHSLPIERLKDLLRTLTSRYEFVICDAPPILPTADASGLVDICDGALMVVRAGVTPRPAASKALVAIDRTKLIGFLLNDVPETRMGRYYYKYYSDVEKPK